MRYFVALIVAVALISLGSHAERDTQGAPGYRQANTFVILLDLAVAAWGAWLLLT